MRDSAYLTDFPQPLVFCFVFSPAFLIMLVPMVNVLVVKALNSVLQGS